MITVPPRAAVVDTISASLLSTSVLSCRRWVPGPPEVATEQDARTAVLQAHHRGTEDMAGGTEHRGNIADGAERLAEFNRVEETKRDLRVGDGIERQGGLVP